MASCVARRTGRRLDASVPDRRPSALGPPHRRSCLSPAAIRIFIVTPRLLLDLPFAWRELAPGAAVSTAVAVLVNGVSSFELHRWLRAYGQAYGAFGIGLGIVAYVGLIALLDVGCRRDGRVLGAQGVIVQRCSYA